MKYALIGCGRISPNHIASAIDIGLKIVAVCDLVTTNMDKIIKEFNLPETVVKYTDYKEMLKKENPELVAIATESGKHAEIALECITSRCNLIIEKPIALSMKDAEKIIEKGKEFGVKVCACHQNRFNKSISKIREAVIQNRFGKLFHATANIRWNRGKNYFEQAKWRGTWEQDGGALMNQCIHNIDLLRWLMGNEIEEVTAYTANLNHDYIEAEDLGVALVKFRNGSFGIVEGTTNVYPSNLEETLYIFGESATVKVGGKSVNVIEEWLFADNMDDPVEVKATCCESPPNVYGFGHKPLYADMVDAIKNNRAPYVTAEDGKRALELVLGIYKSAALGRPVQFPIEDCKTLDFIGKFN